MTRYKPLVTAAFILYTLVMLWLLLFDGRTGWEPDRPYVEQLRSMPYPFQTIVQFGRIILTGNLDVWIAPIIEKLGMKGRCLCSRAKICDDHLVGIASVLDKGAASKKLPHPFVAIGDGSNDVGMIRAADIGIAFGGARKPPAGLIAAADMLVQDENELIGILKRLL